MRTKVAIVATVAIAAVVTGWSFIGINNQPPTTAELIKLGTERLDAGEIREAEKSLTEAIKLGTEDASIGLAHLERGKAYIFGGDLEAAVSDFSEAASTIPEKHVALHWKGVSLLAANRPDEAISAFNTALQTRNDYKSAYDGRGLAHYAKGNWSDASADFRAARALELLPPGNFGNSGNCTCGVAVDAMLR